MTETFIHELFCDGGLIGGDNPSSIGGTWAFCRTEHGKRVLEIGGVVTPSDLKREGVSNNNTELVALLNGIEALPDNWSGRVNSDSRNALGWIKHGYKPASNIPPTLEEEMAKLFSSSHYQSLNLTFRLLQGHPTKEDLRRGIGAKRGLPVSEHNCWCDEACATAGRVYMEELIAEDERIRSLRVEAGLHLREKFDGNAKAAGIYLRDVFAVSACRELTVEQCRTLLGEPWEEGYEKAETENPTRGLDGEPVVGSTDTEMLATKYAPDANGPVLDPFDTGDDAAPVHRAQLIAEIEALERTQWKSNADRMSGRSAILDDLGLDALPALNLAGLMKYRDALEKTPTYLVKRGTPQGGSNAQKAKVAA